MKPWENGELRVSENHRYLKNGNTPFFWLGDTAWLLFARLRPEEARVYLKNRKEKGYTVIQATLIHEWPQKNVDGADALKKLVEKDLNGAIMEGLTYTICDLAKRRKVIHPDAIAAYNDMLLHAQSV